jgi:hypothetical protein
MAVMRWRFRLARCDEGSLWAINGGFFFEVGCSAKMDKIAHK